MTNLAHGGGEYRYALFTVYVVFKGDIEAIEKKAFSKCNSLRKIIFYGELKKYNKSVFAKLKDLTIIGHPGSSVENMAKKETLPFVDIDSIDLGTIGE